LSARPRFGDWIRCLRVARLIVGEILGEGRPESYGAIALFGRKPGHGPQNRRAEQRPRRWRQPIFVVDLDAELLPLGATLDASALDLALEPTPLRDLERGIERRGPAQLGEHGFAVGHGPRLQQIPAEHLVRDDRMLTAVLERLSLQARSHLEAMLVRRCFREFVVQVAQRDWKLSVPEPVELQLGLLEGLCGHVRVENSI